MSTKYLVAAVLLGVAIVAAVKLKPVKEVQMDGTKVELDVGPTHKRLEISNRRGKNLFNIDMYEDEKQINIKPDGQRIELHR